MEIPTKEILKSLRTASGPAPHSLISETTLMEAIATVKAQAREILELQATIVRLKDEHLEQRNREHLERQVDYEARRIRDLGDD